MARKKLGHGHASYLGADLMVSQTYRDFNNLSVHSSRFLA